MPASQSTKEPEEKPNFIFKGTIKKLKSATMPDVPVNERTAVVTVNQLVDAPPGLASYLGQDITVLLAGRQKVQAGDELIFYTVSWMYGESLAVRSLKQETVEGRQRAMLSANVDPVERQADRLVRERFKDADLVVSGKVLSVKLPTGTRKLKGKGAAASDQAEGGPVSEHDAHWREAVIEVDGVHKGSYGKKRLVVRFPESTDVMWYQAPKFQVGQQGYFMLNKADAKQQKPRPSKKRGVSRAAIAATDTDAETPSEDAGTFTALKPADFQPYDAPGGIKTIIESKPEAKEKK